ncbi:hypothetical protein ACOCJ4_07965 [Knoellia sp. CPCC 206435]|uniref:hypothetical protein n=1 Tax=Knoellia terrae TaxID=3404797 RepID=UPI003B43C8F7
MNRRTVRTIAVTLSTLGVLTVAPQAAFAAGPQPLPAAACNDATARASANAPTRTSSEAIPHAEHAYPVPVAYCHHFNPTATPPVAP